MNIMKNGLAAAALAVLLGAGLFPKAQAMNNALSLDARQRSTVTIAAFTASGNMEKLNAALNRGLDAGLTVNEIKEALVQMYAYAGFPRSLNGLNAFKSVVDERKARGLVDEVGKDASPVPADLNRDEYGAKVRASLAGLDHIPPPAAWQKFAPVIGTFLK